MFFWGGGLYYFCSSLYNLDTILCSKVQLAKIFSHSLGGLLIFWKLFFFFPTKLQFNLVYKFLGLFPMQLESHSENFCPHRSPAVFAFHTFRAFGFKIGSLAQFELISREGWGTWIQFPSASKCISSISRTIWWNGPFPVSVFYSFIKNPVSIAAHIYPPVSLTFQWSAFLLVHLD